MKLDIYWSQRIIVLIVIWQLPLFAGIIELTNKNLHEITASDKPVILYFYAAECMPCATMKIVFRRLATNLESMYLFAQVDADNSSELVHKFKVVSFPTFVIWCKNTELGRITREMAFDAFKEKILDIINPPNLALLTNGQLLKKLQNEIEFGTAEDVARIVKAGVNINGAEEHEIDPVLFLIANIDEIDQGLEKAAILLPKKAEQETAPLIALIARFLERTRKRENLLERLQQLVVESHSKKDTNAK